MIFSNTLAALWLAFAPSVMPIQPDSSLLSSEWQLAYVVSRGDTLTWNHDEEAVTLRFSTVPVEDPTIGEGFWFEGVSSCNGFKGAYNPEDGSLGVNVLIATAMLCNSSESMRLETALFNGLKKSSKYAVESGLLTIESHSAKIVMKRRK